LRKLNKGIRRDFHLIIASTLDTALNNDNITMKINARAVCAFLIFFYPSFLLFLLAINIIFMGWCVFLKTSA